jgi:hypothetical protein
MFQVMARIEASYPLAGGWHHHPVRVGALRRAVVVAAAVGAALTGVGCMGGNMFGANPGDGGCGFAPDGLVADDLTGTWEGRWATFTLAAGGVATGIEEFLPTSQSPSASTRPGRTQASPAPGRTPASPSLGRTPASPSPATVTARWTLTIVNDRADLTLTGPVQATFMVSGTREEPWLYVFGEGDPDSCNIVRYDRTAR